MMMGQLVKEDLSVSFIGIEDPRIERHKRFPVEEIIFLAIYGALRGIESWRGLELLGQNCLSSLREFFPFKNGIPSHQTIARVFSLLKPKSFEQFFMAWSSRLNGSNSGRQIALDGKTLKGSFDKSTGKVALHILNACAVESGITLGQMEVDCKTNDIKVVPEMLEALDIKGAMISVDALNTQKEIAEQIVNSGANYTLALKGNHKNLNENVQNIFDKNRSESRFEETEKSHGRLTTRIYDIHSVDKYNLAQAPEWKGLKAIGKVQMTTLKQEKETTETRHYLLSYADVETFAKSARNHWGVESLHWTLDVTFGEDGSRKRKDHAPRNYSLIRKFALNILRAAKGKLSVPNMQIQTNSNPEFLSKLLQQAGFKPVGAPF